ncbi:MAG TPA: hypothetical protein VFA07_02845 [Chthonomonadaceae bacterium]|nr:hypothetical protein [Chthonomonadaceae bacterium]
MTYAVCLHCGNIKFGAWVPCPECGYEPQGLEDQARHMLLSDHYFSQDELAQFAKRIKQGEGWVLDEETTQDYIAKFAEAAWQEEIINQSWDLIDAYRETLEDSEEQEFFDNQDEYTQAVTARLWLYNSRYAARVIQAGEAGGSAAAETEFHKVLTEDPRLEPLAFQRTPALGPDSWIVIHPKGAL